MTQAVGRKTKKQKPVINEDIQNYFMFPLSNLVVKTPWKLNEQQAEALIALEEFRANYNERQFTLCGYAGTGKTSIINLFHQLLRQRYRSPIYSAPTHRALSVINQMNPSARTITLAKIFGLRPEFKIEEGAYTIQDLEFSQQGKPTIEYGDFLIIDECSMVSEALYEFIQQNIWQYGLKVLYVGDSAQIKPVKEDQISRVFENNHGRKITLTKVERTGDNPILKEATDLRNGMDFSRITSLNSDGHGVEYLSKPDARTIIKREFPELSTYPLHIRCLAGTNAVVKSSNKIIRDILNFTNQIEVGEVLMGYDNFGYEHATESYDIINSGDYHVQSVEENVKIVEGIKYSGFDVRLVNAMNHEMKTVFIVDNNEDPDKVSFFVNNVKALNIQAEYYRRAGDRQQAAIHYTKANELKGSLAFMKDHYSKEGKLIQYKTLDYGYSHTIHKSQGGTYDKILIVEDSINAFNDESLKQQLKYVALSRARKNVFIV